MTFTYDLTNVTDLTRVRYHLQDTNPDGPLFSDEEINFAISEKLTYQRATVSLIQALIARMANEPDFRADWLNVNRASQLAKYQELLKQKRAEFGLNMLTATGVPVYRSDSDQTEAGEDW